MTRFLVQDAAEHRLREIYSYTRDTWGKDQAENYIKGLFEQFEAIATRQVLWRRVPADVGVDGFFCRFKSHFIYWRVLKLGAVGIVTILHERMHQIERFHEDFEC